MRTSVTITVKNPTDYKSKLLHWAQSYREVVFLDSNKNSQKYSTYDAILAVEAFTMIQTDYQNAFKDLEAYQQLTKDWLFGYLSYDLKNDIEDLKSDNFDGLAFPNLFFFQPKKIFLLKGNQLKVAYLSMCDDEMQQDLEDIINKEIKIQYMPNPVAIKQRIEKKVYYDKINQILDHIHSGNVYEINFCMEFFAEKAIIDPMEIYRRLNAISEPPFAVYLKHHKQFLLSASPERYLKKEGEIIISQPIKGTTKRGESVAMDILLLQELKSSLKERTENIMITDLVRNDLSRTAQRGSVFVEELCEVYTFKQVHHLISTIRSKADSRYTPVEIIKNTFPMGSMTGAPKIAAMNIIEDLEVTQRGLYSGAVGYFTPDNDFDFNVVIRSILYNQDKQYVSFSVGSAITASSVAEYEYEECMLKAAAMLKVVGDTSIENLDI